MDKNNLFQYHRALLVDGSSSPLISMQEGVTNNRSSPSVSFFNLLYFLYCGIVSALILQHPEREFSFALFYHHISPGALWRTAFVRSHFSANKRGVNAAEGKAVFYNYIYLLFHLFCNMMNPITFGAHSV